MRHTDYAGGLPDGLDAWFWQSVAVRHVTLRFPTYQCFASFGLAVQVTGRNIPNIGYFVLYDQL